MAGSDGVKPADGDDYTYDLHTGPELARMRMDSIEARMAIVESELRTEVRQIAERLQHIEDLLEQCTGSR